MKYNRSEVFVVPQVTELAGYTARVYNMFSVFDEVKRGIYKRTTVIQGSVNNSRIEEKAELHIDGPLEIKGNSFIFVWLSQGWLGRHGAVGQEVNRGFFSVTNQPLSLNAPETMLPLILTPYYLVTPSLWCAFLIHKMAQMFSVKTFNEKAFQLYYYMWWWYQYSCTESACFPQIVHFFQKAETVTFSSSTITLFCLR